MSQDYTAELGSLGSTDSYLLYCSTLQCEICFDSKLSKKSTACIDFRLGFHSRHALVCRCPPQRGAKPILGDPEAIRDSGSDRMLYNPFLTLTNGGGKSRNTVHIYNLNLAHTGKMTYI